MAGGCGCRARRRQQTGCVRRGNAEITRVLDKERRRTGESRERSSTGCRGGRLMMRWMSSWTAEVTSTAQRAGRSVRARLVLPRDSIAYRPQPRCSVKRPAIHSRCRPPPPASQRPPHTRGNTLSAADCTSSPLLQHVRRCREKENGRSSSSKRCRLGAGRGRPQPQRPLHPEVSSRPGCPRAAREEAAQRSVRPSNTRMTRSDSSPQTTTSARTCRPPPRKLAPSSRRSALRSSKPCGPRNMRTACPATTSTSSRA